MQNAQNERKSLFFKTEVADERHFPFILKYVIDENFVFEVCNR